ncbi:MAG: exopolysaccharide biosynthesis protein [Verrucomicrobia bacterium]|nr:exopolysaccharide biosynthesis protein [Verrucomicrobiota bacterium]
MSATDTLHSGILGIPGTKLERGAARRRPQRAPSARKVAATALKPARSRARTTPKSASASQPLRTSQVLKDILAKNPGVSEFSIERIVNSIGDTSFGTSLMFFAIPEVVPIPIPGYSTVVVIPTAVISAQMAVGHKQIKLPRFILKKTVPRKALATAIHAILPLLEKAEKFAKPRWKWASTPLARRLLGLYIFILALSIAFPMPGFNMPQAISAFIIALGIVENDGLLITAGVLGGLASLALLGGAVFGVFAFLNFGFRPW